MDKQTFAFIVICQDGDDTGAVTYHLATRAVFADRTSAERYAATVATSRVPIVVEGRWAGLRLPD